MPSTSRVLSRPLTRIFLVPVSASHPPQFRRKWFTSRSTYLQVTSLTLIAMYLQFYINDNGDKVYTTKKDSPLGIATESAHPARFSPDDKYSRQRVLLKKRFGLLPTQKPPQQY